MLSARSPRQAARTATGPAQCTAPSEDPSKADDFLKALLRPGTVVESANNDATEASQAHPNSFGHTVITCVLATVLIRCSLELK